jgi:hypothetical protein
VSSVCVCACDDLVECCFRIVSLAHLLPICSQPQSSSSLRGSERLLQSRVRACMYRFRLLHGKLLFRNPLPVTLSYDLDSAAQVEEVKRSGARVCVCVCVCYCLIDSFRILIDSFRPHHTHTHTQVLPTSTPPKSAHSFSHAPPHESPCSPVLRYTLCSKRRQSGRQKQELV